MEEGRVRWAQSGEANIAFRVLGDGPVDLVSLGGITSHIEVMLEEPGLGAGGSGWARSRA